jgi:hypothetical protein
MAVSRKGAQMTSIICLTQRGAEVKRYRLFAILCMQSFFSLSYFFHDKKVTKNLVLSKAFLGSKPKLKNRLFARNPKPEAASVILVHYSSPIFPKLSYYHCQPMLLPYAGASDIGMRCLRRVILKQFSNVSIP